MLVFPPGVGVAVGVGEAVAVAVLVGGGVLLAVGVGEAVAVAVLVGGGVLVAVGVGEAVAVGKAVAVLVPSGGTGPHGANLKEAMRVLQLNVPFAFKYSVVYQKVQSSTGSTVIAL